MFEWTLNVGTVLTILTILFTAIGFYWKHTFNSEQFKIDIGDIKLDLKQLNKVIMDLALQNQRLDTQAEWVARIGREVEELRHGKGFVKNVD